MVYGYARVSSKQQNEDRQLDALKAYGVSEENIYLDKESGKNLERENYRILRDRVLRDGDMLVIKELDRLSRQKADIKSELEYFRDKGVRVVILNIPTTMAEVDSGSEWVFDMVNSILIEVLGSIAEEERLKIRRRQCEGIESAHKRGVKFGRPSVKKPRNWEEVIGLYKNHDISAKEAMRRLKLKHTTFYKLLSETE